MATATPSAEALLTAEQFARRPDPGYPEELVRGRVVTMSPPGARHGQICNRLGRLLGNFAEEHDLGHVLNNDSGTITARNPDSVRGPDVSFYAYDKVPKGPMPEGYPETPPDAVFEVMSPSDRWPAMLAKVAEYLDAGVAAVVVVDPEARGVQVYEADRAVRVLGPDDELALPGVLGAFRVRVGRLFA